MMHNGTWFGMGGMWFYWVPLLVVVVVLLAWGVSRRRSRNDR